MSMYTTMVEFLKVQIKVYMILYIYYICITKYMILNLIPAKKLKLYYTHEQENQKKAV